MLEMALGGLLVLCAGLLGFCLWLARRLREQAEQQQVQARGFEQRLRELNKRLDTYLTGSIRMGEELYELRRVVAPLPEKLNQIEQRDPSSLSFTQAARLVGMGGQCR